MLPRVPKKYGEKYGEFFISMNVDEEKGKGEKVANDPESQKSFTVKSSNWILEYTPKKFGEDISIDFGL